MERGLAIVCAAVLASSALASPVTQAPAKQAPSGKQEQPKAEETPLQKAKALLAKIPALKDSTEADPSVADRFKLLQEADARCDAADAAAKDDASKRESFTVRWALASRAFEIGDWSVGLQLYSDALPYVSNNWPADDPFALRAKKAFAGCLSNVQREKPESEREYKVCIGLFSEVADAWGAKLKSALAAPGEGPLSELYEAADAERELGVTYMEFLDRKNAGVHLERAFQMLRDNITRLESPELLRQICADYLEASSDRTYDRLCDPAAKLIEERFPARVDLALSLRADSVQALNERGFTRQATDLAHEVLARAKALPEMEFEARMHVLQTCGTVLSGAGLLQEAQTCLRAAVALEANAQVQERRAIHTRLSSVLVGLRKFDEAIEVLDSGGLGLGDRHFYKAQVFAAEGHDEQALREYEGALDVLTSPMAAQASGYLAGQYGRTWCLRAIAATHARAGRASAALAILEELRGQLQASRVRAESQSLSQVLGLLGAVHMSAGDVRGAYPLFKQALDEIIQQVGPAELPALDSQINLGNCAFLAGQNSEAERLAREVRVALQGMKLTDHPDYIIATENLAEAIAARAGWDEAKPLADEALNIAQAAGDSYSIGYSKALLGSIALGKRDAKQAAALLQEGLGQMPWRPGTGDRESFDYYRTKLITALAALEDSSALQAELLKMFTDAQERLEPLSTWSARERSDVVANLMRQAEQAAVLCAARPELLDRRTLFEWMANLRAAAGPLEIRSLVSTSKELGQLWDEALRTRRRVGALTVNFLRHNDLATDPESFQQAHSESEAAEHRLIEKLPKGSRFAWIGVSALAVKLGTRSALGVSIDRARALPPQQMEDHFMAFVLDGKAQLRQVDLGPAAPIEAKIQAWRRAVTGGQRGRAVPTDKNDVRALGCALRKAVLDPLLAGAEQKRVFLCLDDALHTIPWDALPATDAPEADKDPLVGDRVRIAELSSFRDLQEAAHREGRQPALLALGDIDYSAPGAAAKDVPLADRPMRGSTDVFGNFETLVASADEVTGIKQTFEETQRAKATLLTSKAATKAALFEAAPNATYLHISTHGYFASEDIPALGSDSQGSLLNAITGFAPWSLCGLALAGANRDVGALEEVVGIVTAEELAGLNLSACKLAVLSGCDTNLGVRRAGQDLASLQSALHAAGAGMVVASLWEVPDSQTSKLMRRFYTKLWKDGLPADEALWQAKQSFRDQPLAAWAGWVFSGVPETK